MGCRQPTVASLLGKGSKIGKICRRIVVKKLPSKGGRGQKSRKICQVLNGLYVVYGE